MALFCLFIPQEFGRSGNSETGDNLHADKKKFYTYYRYCAALKGYITFKENKHLENTYFALLRVAVHHHQALQFQEEVDDTSGWSPFGLENIHVKPAYSAD